MTDEITSVSSKLEREMKFTRSLLLLCTAAILGTLLLILTMISSQLPDLIYLKFVNDPMNTGMMKITRPGSAGSTTDTPGQ